MSLIMSTLCEGTMTIKNDTIEVYKMDSDKTHIES